MLKLKEIFEGLQKYKLNLNAVQSLGYQFLSEKDNKVEIIQCQTNPANSDQRHCVIRIIVLFSLVQRAQ